MHRLRQILLVEDSPQDRELILAGLSELHLANEVVSACDGAEALDYLYCRGRFEGRSTGVPVAVLLDIKMPKVDGLEVLRRIRGDARLATLPVVMLTSSREEQDIFTSYRLGVNAFVTKPVGFTEFIEAVKQLGLFWAVLNEPPPAPLEPKARGASAGVQRFPNG